MIAMGGSAVTMPSARASNFSNAAALEASSRKARSPRSQMLVTVIFLSPAAIAGTRSAVTILPPRW
jgi:hypothetical protein